jgi:hypothetical protein
MVYKQYVGMGNYVIMTITTSNPTKHTCMVYRKMHTERGHWVPKYNTLLSIKEGVNPDGVCLVTSDALVFTTNTKYKTYEYWVECYVFKQNTLILFRADWFVTASKHWEEII